MKNGQNENCWVRTVLRGRGGGDITPLPDHLNPTLYRKAQAYEAGEKIEFGGRDYPPLYTPRNSTLRELFDISEAPAAASYSTGPRERLPSSDNE